jgi:hypothetical protein
MRSPHEASKSPPNLAWWALFGMAGLIAAAFATFVILNLVGLR